MAYSEDEYSGSEYTMEDEYFGSEYTIEDEHTFEDYYDDAQTPTNAGDRDIHSTQRDANLQLPVSKSPASLTQLKKPNIDGLDDDETCTICLESWTSSGPHRLVCLRCGHLFGKTCIEKWASRNPTCPTCHMQIRKQDVRIIYARSLRAVDTCELEQIKSQLKQQTAQRKNLEVALTDLKLQYHMLELELYKVKQENKLLRQPSKLTSNLSNSPKGQMTKLRWMHSHQSDIPKDHGGRVLIVSAYHGLIIYSQQSSTPLYKGHGITKVNLVDPRMTEYVPLHSMMIRDLSTNLRTGTLLSCSMDSTARLFDLRSNTVLTNYVLPSPAWSCAWMEASDHHFYVGGTNGTVYVFDSRMDDQPVECLLPLNSIPSPVATLQAITSREDSSSGMFVGSLLKAGIYSAKPGSLSQSIDHTYHAMSVKGSILSAHFDVETKHLAVSLRPTKDYPHIYHTDKFDNLEFISSIQGSRTASYLTRARLLRMNEKNLYICAYDERQTSKLIVRLNRQISQTPPHISSVKLNPDIQATVHTLLTYL